MRARTRRSNSLLLTVLVLTTLGVGIGTTAATAGPNDPAAATPTSTVAPTTTTTAQTTTTSLAATTTAAAVPTATEAGPPPRSSQRVAAAIDIEKIRPTSLPLRTMAIATAAVIAGLAIAGFVYGRVRSRVPGVGTPRPVTSPPPASDATVTADPVPLTALPPMPLPPPRVTPLPPPESVNEWAPPRA